MSPTVLKGETVSPYQVDFDTEINTSVHDFRVASNWKHIVHKYNDGYSDYYMSYSYKTTDGVSGSGALLAYEQKAGDNYDNEVTYDLMVTPVVSGTVSLKVKAFNNNGYVEFYSLNETATARNERLGRFTVSGGNFNQNDYSEISISVDEPQRIGIRASYVYIDDFHAETAEIEQEKSMVILTAEPSNTSGQIKWDQQADKSVLVKFTNITVKNTSEAYLTAGDKNYSISIINGKTKAALGKATPVPYNLAAGETSEPFEVSVNIPETEIKNLWSYSSASAQIYLMENLQGSIVQRALSYYNAYESKFIFQEPESTSSSSLSGTIDFGMVYEPISKTFIIKNDGAAPLQIVSVSVPAGYTSDIPAGAFEVESHSQLEITLTMTDEQGAHNGNLEIVYKDNSGNDKTYSIAVSGNLLSVNTWYTDFKGGENKSDVVYPLGSVAESGIKSGYSYSSGIYNPYLASYTNTDYTDANNKFITPLLHAQAGDVMTFDVARDASGSKYNLKVYVSTDRVNWGEPVATTGYDDLSGSAFVNKSIEFPAEGNYYVGFAVYGMKLDNIIGLQKVDVNKDLYFSEVKQSDKIKSGDKFSSTISVYAPLAATSGEYTVKYYIDDEVAATIASKDMAADAKNSKTFSTGDINPTVEQTSDYATYFEFAFVDGPVFRSPVKTLTVTYEPWFVFVTAGTTVNSDIQAKNYTTPIDFGTGNQSGLTKNFEILNFGSAPLTVKSIEVPDGFSVNVDKATLASKERQAVDVTFSAETEGTYSGEMKITYVDATGADTVFSIEVKGTMLDPNKWYASFDDENYSATGAWPVGSLYQSGVSKTKDSGYATVAMCGNGGSSEADLAKSMFITPLLKAEAGESFSFDARIYSTSWKEGVVEVYAAKSREDLANADTRTALGKWSGKDVDNEHLLTDKEQTFSVTLDEAGEYYLGFRVYSRVRVDNIYGLSLVPVAHDIMVSANVPATGIQNKLSTAIVTLQNIGLNAEDEGSYTVASYVNGVKVDETAGAALPTTNSLSEGKVNVDVQFRSPKVGTYPVYFEVTFEDGKAYVTEPADVEFTEEILSSEVVVGIPNGFTTDAPLKLNYRYSESVTLYTPDDLGLTAGDKIKSIVMRGYCKDAHTTDLKVAYEWTDDKDQTKPNVVEYDFSGMTVCLDKPGHEWNNAGTGANNIVDLITVVFDEPIVYEDGKSLRLFVKSSSTTYKNYNFEKSTTKRSYSHWNDNSLKNDWAVKDSPVLHLTLAVEARTYTPTVVDGNGEAVAGATVTLISNDGDNVQYEGTTGEDGTCSINVIQSNRIYDVEVKSEAGEAYIEGVNVADASVETDIVLMPVVMISDESVHAAENKDAAIVYLNTVFEAGFNAVALPIALDEAEVAELFGEYATVMEFTGETRTDNEVRAHFTTVKGGMEAGKPYMVHLTETTVPTMYKGKAVVAELQTVAKDHLNFVPATEATPLTDGMYMLTDDNYELNNVARMSNGIETVKPYRAYMRVTDPNVTAVSFDNSENISTGVDSIDADATEGADVIYNLNGVRVVNPVKGNIYIVNGKTVLLK